MKNTAIPLLSVALLLLTGCTNSFAQVRSAVNHAPEWYGERRVEIRGEGYPEIADVPVIDKANPPGARLALPAERIDALRALFDSNPRAEVTAADLDGVTTLVAAVRAEFADFTPSPNMLTGAEIAAIRDSFNVPRVTEGPTIRQ